MTDLKSYIQYFQTLAASHIDIHDFYIMDINEPLNGIRDMQFPAMILTSITGNLLATNLDNPIDSIKGGFLIIDRLEDASDFINEMEILEATKITGIDVISKIISDIYTQSYSRDDNPLQGFNPSTVAYQMVDGIFDNCFGFSFTFQVDCTVDLSPKPEKWTENVPEESQMKY